MRYHRLEDRTSGFPDDCRDARPPVGSRGRRPEGPQDGFALLVSLIAIVGLTALATGGFFLANSERKTSSNHHATVEAFYLANAGLSEFVGNWKGTPPRGTATMGTYDYADGQAVVTTTFMGYKDDDTDAPMYRVASRGAYDPNDTGDPVERTVGKIAVLNKNQIKTPPAPLTSGPGVRKNGSSGKLSGVDECGQQSDRPGVIVPEDGWDFNGNEEQEDDLIDGNPDGEAVEADDPFGPEITADWWQSMIDGTGILHDHVVGGDSGNDFPDLSDADMPVTYVDEDGYTMGSGESGEGLLIVRGDVTLKGGFDWDGIILAGGALTDNGVGQIEGGMVTGLNILMGDDVGDDDLEDTDDDDTLNGTKKFLFHSCFIDQLKSKNAVMLELSGTWHETI